MNANVVWSVNRIADEVKETLHQSTAASMELRLRAVPVPRFLGE